MKIRNILGLLVVLVALSFAQSDSTKQVTNKKIVTVQTVATVTESSKVLNKMLIIRQKKTTWSQIKDLFM